MHLNKKIGAVVIAYNAARTIRQTLEAIDRNVVDHVVVSDDGSSDNTTDIARKLGVQVAGFEQNKGPGANTKAGFENILKSDDINIVVLLHGDNQYDPKKILNIIDPIARGRCDFVLGNRIDRLRGGMPLYKRVANSSLAAFQNFMFSQKLCDYATGYKAFSREVLESVNWRKNKNTFEFDEQLNAQILMKGYRVMNIPVPTRYFKEASSVNFRQAVIYGYQSTKVALAYLSHKRGMKSRYSQELFK